MLRVFRYTCYRRNVFGAQLRVVWLCVSPLPSLPCCMQSAHCTEQRIEAESANKRSPPPITGTALYEPLNIWMLHSVPLVWSFLLLDLFSLIHQSSSVSS
jgi:hypothetical protein